jgi:hypothetical protein
MNKFEKKFSNYSMEPLCTDEVHDQRTIEKAGTIEALSSLLTTKGIDEAEKTKIRKVISKIIATP